MTRPLATRLGLLALKLAVALLVTCGLLEGVLHLVPGLIPTSYRQRFPLHGVGLFEPDLLARTPVHEVPLPLYVGSYTGPPPQDLVEKGLVPEGESSDARRHPVVELVVDELGLPNPSIPERADVVLVGDSFMVSAGASRPAGLQVRLADSLGKSVYNVGVAATGPLQQLWLLEAQGMPKQPELVIWFFFGGNDALDTATTLRHLNRGEDTYGKVHAGREPPTLRLPSVVRFLVGSERAARRIEPHPGLLLPRPGAEPQPLWMLPNYLWVLSWTKEQWAGYPGWTGCREPLVRARDLVEATGARFLLVYLPSKAQIYLPHVEPDAELVAAMTDFQRPQSVTGEPDAFLAAALRHRGDHEELVRELCQAEGIAYLSATPCLEALAAQGELTFFAADTHWEPRGQEAVLEALLAVLEE